VKLPDVNRGVVLLPRRWLIERAFAWMRRCMAASTPANDRDQERLAGVLKGRLQIP
jgi:transposase